MRIHVKTTISIIILCLLCSCVNGNSPAEQPAEIKGMSNRLDVNHLKVEQTPELEEFATKTKGYLGDIQEELTQLGHLLETGDKHAAVTLNESLINKSKQWDQQHAPELFSDLQDLHHSYYVTLQELQDALNQNDVNDQQLHYGYSVLTIRLFSVEFQSLIEQYGIKAAKS